MILTIDIGNTAITMGLFTPEGRLQFRGSLKTDKNKTRDQIAKNCKVNNLSESKLKFRSLVKIKRPAYGTKIHLMNLATGLDTKIMI